MTDIPEADITHASYENVFATCPRCGKENIFNRASDLKTFEGIDSLNVSCQNDKCRNTFHISGDWGNGAHEILIFDCYALLRQKSYMQCILNLAQAYEVFFDLFLRVELLYKPFAADPHRECAELNRLSKALGKKIEGLTFARMRTLFLRHIVARYSPRDLVEAKIIIDGLPGPSGHPADAAIEGIGDVKLIRFLKALMGTQISSLRNQVVHKQAYRPTREEVKAALEETAAILLPLTNHLRLYDDINMYIMNS